MSGEDTIFSSVESKDSMGDGGIGAFRTTQWTAVVQAGCEDSEQARVAIEGLCNDYWYPLYAYARRKGNAHHDAQDLVQGFLMRVIEKRQIAKADRSRGRFRTFLLTAFKYFISDEYDRRNALKRGGGKAVVSLDETSAEVKFRSEPSVSTTPEKVFARNWSESVLERATLELRRHFEKIGKIEFFESLLPCLWSDTEAPSYRELGARFGLSESACKVAIHRVRAKFREALRAEVARTVSNPEEVDDEIRYVFEGFSAT